MSVVDAEAELITCLNVLTHTKSPCFEVHFSSPAASLSFYIATCPSFQIFRFIIFLERVIWNYSLPGFELVPGMQNTFFFHLPRRLVKEEYKSAEDSLKQRRFRTVICHRHRISKWKRNLWTCLLCVKSACTKAMPLVPKLLFDLHTRSRIERI